jgi:hypothetical protein
MRSSQLVSACIVLVLVGLERAHAQIPGLPVHFSPGGRPGVIVAGDYALGGKPLEHYVGGRLIFDAAFVTVTGGVGKWGAASEVSWGGSAALNLIRGSMRPIAVSLQAGVGATTLDDTAQDAVDLLEIVPVGVGIGIDVMLAGIVVEPWVAGRIHVRRLRFDPATLAGDGTDVGWGVSTGIDARSAFIKNFGFHVAVDFRSVPEPNAVGRHKALLVNLGLRKHFRFMGWHNRGVIP